MLHLLTIAFVVGATLVVARPEDAYTTEFDAKTDIDALFAVQENVDAITKCFLGDDSTCIPQAKAFRGLLPEIVATNCEKCSAKQKEGLGKYFVNISKNRPEDLQKIVAKYDPTGDKLKNYGDFWKAQAGVA